MLSVLNDNSDFANKNLNSWIKNTDYWIKNRKLDEKVIQLIGGYINAFLEDKIHLTLPHIVDIGCGYAWFLNEMQHKLNYSFSYSGIDFNKSMIEKNRKILNSQANINFICHDAQEEFYHLINQADIVVCCLTLIEIPNIVSTFKNIYDSMSKSGILIVISLDSVAQMVRISTDALDFIDNYKYYRESDKTLFYEKAISTTTSISSEEDKQRSYYGIMHSTSDIINIGITSGFSLKSFDTINERGVKDFKNPIYQAFLFIK